MNEHLHQKVGGAQGAGGWGVGGSYGCRGWKSCLLIRTVFSVNSNHGFYSEGWCTSPEVCGRGCVAASDGGGGCKVEAAVHQSAPPPAIQHQTHYKVKWESFFLLY